MIKIISTLILVYSFFVGHARLNQHPSPVDSIPEEILQKITPGNNNIDDYVQELCDDFNIFQHPQFNFSFMSYTSERVFMNMEEATKFLFLSEEKDILRCPFKSLWIDCVYNIHYYQINITELHTDVHASRQMLRKAFHIAKVPCDSLQNLYALMSTISKLIGAFLLLSVFGVCCYGLKHFCKRKQKNRCCQPSKVFSRRI